MNGALLRAWLAAKATASGMKNNQQKKKKQQKAKS